MKDRQGYKKYHDPVSLLQKLIQFNTTNPPGNEAAAIGFINDLLKSVGIKTKVVGDPDRPNLIAILKGKGSREPFLMYGHIDVVTTDKQDWQHPPFSGQLAEGFIWGRGALDMKGPLTMMISAMLRLKKEQITPAGDIILNIVSDEEGSGKGARYIVEEYEDLLKDVQYALGEVGGFTLHLDKKKFYPIMIAEKQRTVIKVKIKGPAGHGSLPMRGGAMARLGNILSTLDQRRLPVHITPAVEMMMKSLADNMSFPASILIRQLLKPVLTDRILNLLGDKGKFFDPILHNTVNATIVQGGNKINVIPGEITLQFDGRILPGLKPATLVSELNTLLGSDLKFEVEAYEPGPDKIDMGLYNTLAELIMEDVKDAIPIPFVLSGVTDARFYASLGIQTYGFTPMVLPEDIDFSSLFHGANERIPITALEFGCQQIYRLLKRMD